MKLAAEVCQTNIGINDDLLLCVANVPRDRLIAARILDPDQCAYHFALAVGGESHCVAHDEQVFLELGGDGLEVAAGEVQSRGIQLVAVDPREVLLCVVADVVVHENEVSIEKEHGLGSVFVLQDVGRARERSQTVLVARVIDVLGAQHVKGRHKFDHVSYVRGRLRAVPGFYRYIILEKGPFEVVA